MKYLFLLLLSLPMGAFAQNDFCGELKFSEDKMRGWKMYTTAGRKPSVYVSRVLQNSTDSSFIGFVLGEPISAPLPQKGAFVLFQDSTAFRDENAQVTVLPIAGKYYYGARVYLDDKARLAFTSKKIAKYGIGGFTGKLSADKAEAIPYYIECLQNSKF